MTNTPNNILTEMEKDERLKTISAMVDQKLRISTDDANYLYNHGSLGFLGSLANRVREAKNGNKTFFNRNFHIEPTNVCIFTCNFCSYSRLIKKRDEGWEYTIEDMMNIVKSFDGKPVTEVHIVGGVLPQYDTAFYKEFFKQIKSHRPELHIKALTPVEFHYIFKKDKLTYLEGLTILKEAGLDSIPGGGAEIFHPEIRQKIAADKCTGDQWLELHRVWHNMGGKSNATMLYGHIESYEHRVDHLDQLRNLQDETGGFQTFIPLKFRNQDNDMSYLDEVTIIEDLRNYAISRIFLDNFDHIKAYWPMIGRDIAQMSLSFGVDDIDGTIDDTTKIYSMAGSEEQNPALSTKDLVNLIKGVNREPIERDTLYQVVKDYTYEVFEDDGQFKGYLSLPVSN
ncbi:MAG: CofH family radical SAM protein [Saprospiraceae bacterium]|nr:CofH family radical SAM protein [Saprospiraceae bacterium]